jgi:energy-coupling factor transporter ATP-binding protein EcfA2
VVHGQIGWQLAELSVQFAEFGLVAYASADAQVLYGREEMTFRLQHKLVVERLTSGGLLLVTGPSGAGKSSLLRAGLIPALRRGAVLPASRAWPCRVMTPTGRPLRELAAVLAELTGQGAAAVYTLLQLDPARAGRLVAEAPGAGGVRRPADRQRPGPDGDTRHLVLIVDQFEELFTQGTADADGQAERAGFVAALEALTGADAGRRGQAPALVVAAIRGDFLDQLPEYAPLAAAHRSGPFLVEPMTPAEAGLTSAEIITPDGQLNAVAFSPDGASLATAGADGTVRLWNTVTQQQVGSTITAAANGAAVDSITFSPTGTQLAAAESNGTVALLNPLVKIDPAQTPQTLCDEVGLPSASTWSKYADNAITEPPTCHT